MPTFHERRLPNGLTIVAETDAAAHTAAAGFFVKTGARDELTQDMGVSHFLEHMMFKGTHDISADELNRRFDAIGARNNAYTSNELTCFYAHMLPETLDTGLDLLARMMRPALRQADFDTEKNVILEEIAMYRDQPFWVLYESCVERHFGTHPLSHRVLGTAQSIKDLQQPRMLDYFNQRYSADNTVVALAGKLDFDRCCDSIERLCGNWQPTHVSRNNTPPPIVGGELNLTDAKVNRGYLLAMCKAPAIDDDRKYAAALLAQVLGCADNSRLHWSLVEPGIAEDCQASCDPHDGFGEFFVFASGDPQRLPEIESIIRKELDNLVDSLEQDDLDKLRTKIATAATIGGEKPQDRMHRLGRHFTYLRRYLPLEAEIDRISAVTLDDVRETAAAFPILPLTTGRLVPAA